MFDFIKKLFRSKPEEKPVELQNASGLDNSGFRLTPEISDRLRVARSISGKKQGEIASILNVNRPRISEVETCKNIKRSHDLGLRMVRLYESMGVWDRTKGKTLQGYRAVGERHDCYGRNSAESYRMNELVIKSGLTDKEIAGLIGYDIQKSYRIKGFCIHREGFPREYADKAFQILEGREGRDIRKVEAQEKPAPKAESRKVQESPKAPAYLPPGMTLEEFRERCESDTERSFAMTAERRRMLCDLRDDLSYSLYKVEKSTGINSSSIANWEQGKFKWGDRKIVTRLLDFYAVSSGRIPAIVRQEFKELEP